MTSAPAPLSAVAIAERLGRPRPTAEQAAVIEAPVEPLLVVAGAGSGKTETMSARVVWLVANGHVRPEEVLGLTFTRKAAGELAERVRRRLRALRARSGVPAALDLDAGEPTIATYHSYAASLVADHGLRLGVEPQSTVLTEAGAWQLATDVVEGWRGDLGGLDAAPETVTRALLDLSGECAEHLVDPAELGGWIERLIAHVERLPRDDRSVARAGAHVPGEPFAGVKRVLAVLRTRRLLVPLLQEYARRKGEREQLDFSDQVRLAARLAQEVRVVGAGERTRFRVVLLDEYQDTSHAQLVLLQALFGGGHPVTAVGDPNQSIYGWRGAGAGSLQDFPTRFRRADGGPAAVAPLSTSWRNDAAVLAVANVTAAPLAGRAAGDATGDGGVLRLRARPDAGDGRVRVAIAGTVEEEAAQIAARLAEVWSADTAALASGARERRRSTAVLCRKRSQFVPLQRALRAAGLPVQVVGLGGLLSTPEVADLVSALHVLHDPARGDHLVRLLTGARWRIGARDLEVLARWARELERIRGGARRDGAAAPADAVLADTAAGVGLVEALDALPRTGWATVEGRRLSPEGRRRLEVLARTLRVLRARSHQGLVEFVGEVERALLLDIEVAARPGSSPGHDRANLDAFTDAAASFAATAQRPTLGGLLVWLDAAQAHERGLEPGAVEVDPEAVQVLTVHASKGLEWDVVAVPGLVEGVFPAASDTASGWLGELGSLPYPLRGDRAHLPSWRVRVATQKELEGAREEFRSACGAHDVAEERRLAYVAFTRAREELLLSAARWDEPATPREPSRFLTELLAVPAAQLPGLVALPPAPAPPPGAPNPRTARPQRVVWPVDPLAARREEVERGAALVRSALRASGTGGWAALLPAVGGVAGEEAGEEAREWWRQAGLLLAERAGADGPPEVLLPAHLSASRMVALAADPQALALQLRRPVPEAPRPQTRRGTAFHAWLEQRFTAGALLDLEELPGAADEDAADDAEMAALQANFLASEWASRDPVAVEVAVETPVAGLVVRGRIDAVFRSVDATGAVHYDLVDWKTGRPPTGARARARDVQLAVYRLAWSRLRGVPAQQVSAAFFHASTGETVRPVDLLDVGALEALVTSVPVQEAPGAPAGGSRELP